MRLRLTYLFLFVLLPLMAIAQGHRMERQGRVVAHGLRFNPERDTQDMPEALREVLRAYRTKPRYAERMTGKRVEPLLQSVRHQEEPFNMSCPTYRYDDGREEAVPSGCVATCLEQVVSYWRHPAVLADTLYGWETDNYTVPDVLPGTPIDWDNILNDYRQGYNEKQEKAVADLTYYLGMATRMSWSPGSSGASLYRAVDALYSAFDFKTIALVQRCMYSPDTWNRMLRRELEAGRPICYSGHNMAFSGHAFNIDGVDEEGYYHINWGYGGSYDGWFDLDYLNPFEQSSDATELGALEGLQANCVALFMHPDDFVIDVFDTLHLADALHGVEFQKVEFRRKPTNRAYTIADLTLHNTTSDTLRFTFEALTYLPTDTAIFRQGDYVGLSAVTLLPGETKVSPLYCQFADAGERILAFTTDEETLYGHIPVVVDKASFSKLEFTNLTSTVMVEDDELAVRVSVDVRNLLTNATAGDLITFGLLWEDNPDDQRHWQVLNLPSGQKETLSVVYHHLQPQSHYRVIVRWPWAIQIEGEFDTGTVDAVESVTCDDEQRAMRSNDWYDLQGRPVGRPVGRPLRGIYIKHGKKIIIP